MADALVTSIGADPRARRHLIGYAVTEENCGIALAGPSPLPSFADAVRL